jgi:hypothetical protein
MTAPVRDAFVDVVWARAARITSLIDPSSIAPGRLEVAVDDLFWESQQGRAEE